MMPNRDKNMDPRSRAEREKENQASRKPLESSEKPWRPAEPNRGGQAPDLPNDKDLSNPGKAPGSRSPNREPQPSVPSRKDPMPGGGQSDQKPSDARRNPNAGMGDDQADIERRKRSESNPDRQA
jgi:hypothetical protein